MLGSDLLNIFAKSPVKPMQQHMSCIYDCVKLLQPFLDAVLAKNWQEAEGLQTEITTLESQADKIKRDIRIHLPNSLFLPVPRAELLSLLTIQDKIASKSKHISGLMLGRKMLIPDTISASYREFLIRSIDATKQARRAIYELEELVETGFGGMAVQLVTTMIDELDRVELDTDKMQMGLRQELFAIEKTLHPVDVIFLYKIIDWTAELADRAQHVGYRLETMLAQ